MKRFAVMVSLGALVVNGWAAEQRFQVTLRGTVETPTGKTTITESNLLSAPYNRLVLILDAEGNTVAIEEWGPGLTAKIDRSPVLSGSQALMENFRMAYIGVGKPRFMANLEMVDMDWDRDGVDDTDGNLQMDAKVLVDRASGQIKRVNANLLGVLNDPINGAAGGPAKHFRGKLATLGPAF